VNRFIDSIGKITNLTLFLLVFLILFDTLNRYLFSSGSIALQELEWHLFDIVILFSVSYTLLYNRNVKVDLFYENLSEKWRDRVDLFSHLLFIAPFSIVVAIYSYDFAYLSYQQMESSSSAGGLQYRFIVKSLITVGFSMLFVLSISQATKKISKIF